MKTTKNSAELVTGLIILLWLLAVFAAYMVTHKPFTPEQFLNLLLVGWRIIVSLALVVLAGGIGMLARVDKLSQPPLTTAMLSAGLGFGILAIYVLTWGSLVGVNFSIFIFPAIAAFFIRKNILNWLKLWHPMSWRGMTQEMTWIGKFILISIAILLFCQLVIALAPPLRFDTLTYHFSIPQAYILEGRIHYIPELMFWGMPQVIEMLYTLAMLAGGAEAAAVLSWLVGILALAGLAGFVRKTFGADPAFLAVASLMSGATLITDLSSGYVEWASILYGLSTLALLLKWLESEEKGSLLIAGVMAGLALSVKYTSGLSLLTGVVAILVFKRSLKPAVVFGVVATGVFMPWLVKNGIATGNPFYPLIFPSPDFDMIRMGFYNIPPISQDWTRLIMLPWMATVMGIDGRVSYSASIGALMLSFSPLAFVFWNNLDEKKRRVVLICTTILVTGMLTWAIGSQFRELLIQSRLYTAIFPAWVLLAAAGFSELGKLKAANVRFGNIASALVALSLVFVTYETILTTTASGAADLVLGVRNQDSYLQNNLAQYPNAMSAIRELPAGSRVLMLWETRGYYCEPVCDSDEIIDRWFHDWRTTGDVDKIIENWQSQGYTHLLLRNEGMNFIKTEDKVAPFTSEDWQALERLLKKLIILKEFGNSYTLYTLDENLINK